MKNFVLAAFIVLYAASSYSAKKVEHYEGEKPASYEQAIKILTTKLQAIDNILSDGKADEYDLEEIHEISYSLEAAIDFILEQELSKEQKVRARYLDKKVQNLHHESEARNIAKTILYFKQLKTSFSQLKAEKRL